MSELLPTHILEAKGIIENGKQELAVVDLLKLLDLLMYGRVRRRLAFSTSKGYFVFWTTERGEDKW